MEDSDDRKRKKPGTLLEDGLTSLNPPKFAKSQDEVAISKLDRCDSDGGATKLELDPKGEENGSVGEEVKQEEQLSSHSGGEGQGAKKNEALDPQGTGSYANGKDKEIVKDKGKGKILVDSETEEDDDEEDGGVDEDTDSDLSDDPLIEVDPANILSSWTRRRTAHSGPYPMSAVPGVDDDDDEDDDDISGDEDEDDDDEDEDDEDDDEDEDDY